MKIHRCNKCLKIYAWDDRLMTAKIADIPCPECGGVLEVTENTTKPVKCEYCQKEFVITQETTK